MKRALFPTAGADTFYHIVDGVGMIPFGECYLRDGDIFEAVDFMATLAIEVHMHIGDGAMTVAVASFIFLRTAAIIYAMYDIVFKEERQGAEDTRLVHGANTLFELGKAYRMCLLHQRVKHDNPVGGGSHPFSLQYLFRFLHTYITESSEIYCMTYHLIPDT